MSGDELRTRVRHEVSKRLDGALYKVGKQPRLEILPGQSRPPGKFFFSPDGLPNRVRLIREHLPFELETLIAEAEEICRHRFRLLGYENLDYGPEIDWHLDVVHGKRTPLSPWFKIDFLDFSQAGDHKITWELNRHQHLVTLAKAWLFTRQDKFATEAIAQWCSWQRANPYPLGVNWASSLEVAFRTLSWLWLRQLLAECAVLPADFEPDLLRGLALNGRHIDRYLSTYFSPNTHLLGEAVALFFLGTLCPQIAAAEKWKKQGWGIIQEEAQRQVRPDGVYFEQSLYYHVYALDFFLHARLLASRNAVDIAPGFDQVIRRMLAVVQALAQCGPADGFGDDDGGRIFNPRRNGAEHLTDPLPVGAALFHDEGLRSSATLTEEAIWLFGTEALDWTSKPDHSARGAESQCFAEGGLYISASGGSFPQQSIIDAGPQGTGRSGHGHADALSMKLSFGKRRWLVDAGTFVYIAPGKERQAFRGTRAHNTLAVDGLDQAQPEGPFAWSSLAVTRAEGWIPAPSFSFFSGSHSGYERLTRPVRHRRFVFHLHGVLWLVRDVAEGAGNHLLETSWHFAPDLEVSDLGRAFQVTPSSENTTSASRSNRLIVLPVSDSRWNCGIITGHVSPAYGVIVPAPVIRCSVQAVVPAEHAMLLLPALEANEKPGTFRRVDDRSSHTDKPDAVYEYEDGETSHRMIFGRTPSAAWTLGPWKTDARFLYYRARNRHAEQLICCEGSFLQFQNESLLAHEGVLPWLEYTKGPGSRRILCSDESAAKSFNSDALESGDLP
jgi:hypothetical protein